MRIEIVEAVEGLSKLLDLELKIGARDAIGVMRSVTERMENTNKTERQNQWTAVARAFYKWDAEIQDALIVPATQAAAYQLGRALAETYWALDPERSDNEMGSWAFLFGDERQRTVARLLARLSAYLDPLAIAAINHSFQAWCTLAADQTQRNTNKTRPALYRQGLLWRDLARGERQPLDLAPLSGTAAWNSVCAYRQAVETLKGPLLAGGLFTTFLVAGGAFLASGARYAWLTAALSILGALGVTSAGLYARAKAQITSLAANLQLAVNQERVSQGATLCPAEQQSAPSAAPAITVQTT